MADAAERLRARLDAIFAAREARVRAEREREQAAARRRAWFLGAFRERVSTCVVPAFEVAADTVKRHGFEGRVKSELEPEEGPPGVRFEMHPEASGAEDPALGRATLGYEADPDREVVRVAATVGGGSYAAFARSHAAHDELALDALGTDAIERHLAELVARALDEAPPPEGTSDAPGPAGGGSAGGV